MAVADFDVLHGAASELGLEVLGVLAEGLSELGTGRVNRSGPVLDFVGDVDLSARGALLKNERVEVGAASVDRGRKSGRAGAEYYKFSLFHSENILSYFLILLCAYCLRISSHILYYIKFYRLRHITWRIIPL